MALGATMFRFNVELSDVDRGVYETLEIRAAQQPSETDRFLIARILGYCLHYCPGLEFGRGVSTAEDAAIWVRDGGGQPTLWIDVGCPSAERLHRASKTGARVVVLSHEDPKLLLRNLDKKTIHRREELEIVVLPTAVVDWLVSLLTRNETWALTLSDGTLYLARGEQSLEGPVGRA